MTTAQPGFAPPVAVAARLASPLGATLAAGLGCAYIALNDPYDPAAAFPLCPTRVLTGLDCPACGGLRMTRALLYGDVRRAAAANLLLFVLTPVVIVGWAVWWRSAWRGRPPPRLSSHATWALLAVAAAWTVARNVL